MFKVGDYIMNAIKFIKDNGVEKAREVVECAPKDAELFHTNTYIKNAHSEGRTDHFARWSDGFNGWVNASADREFIDESIALEELKRLVESLDLVTAWGGLESTYSKFRYAQEHKNTYAANMIQQAIADYQSIYSNDMGDDTHIENHVSPLCHHHWVDGLDGDTLVCAHKCGA